MIVHLDTSVLVDLIREKARGDSGPASGFLARHLDDEFRMSLFAACELMLGVERSDRGIEERRRVEEILSAVPLTMPTPALAPAYGRVLAGLQRRGETIATMDALIGVSALVDGVPLATRNATHFERIPDLRVLGY